MADDNKVVKLRQPQPKAVVGVATTTTSDPIVPKSFLNMTELEQNTFLEQLRSRRLRAAEVLKQARIARQYAVSIVTVAKLEKKAAQVQKYLERATNAIEKLEEQLYSLRTLTIQHTDVDITKV